MLFQSLDFLLFFPLIVLVYFLLPAKQRWWWVLSASYFFYAFWNPFYLLLLWASTATDFFAAKAIEKADSPQRKKRWLGVSLVVNLGLLTTFKYYDFFAEQFAWIIRWYQPDFQPYLLDVLLPIGISFYTFQTIGYTIDVFRGEQKAVQNLGTFANYVSFFPQLIAGPIERGKDLLPQLHFDYRFDPQRITEGLRLFLWGLFKKVVVADRIGMFVWAVFSEPGMHQGWVVLIAGYLFFFQIYYDFTAYQDMAVGVARMLGIRLSKNFEPLILLSRSFRKFWRGWHMTLTQWIRDYVYRPFNLYDKQFGKLSIGPLLVFFLVGLWHGANWTYVIWGTLHGVFLIAERHLAVLSTGIGCLFGQMTQRFVGFLFFFNAFTVANIFFCSSSLREGVLFIGRIFQGPSSSLNPGIPPIEFNLMWIILLLTLLFEYQRRHLPIMEFLNLRQPALRWALYLLLGLAVWFLRIPQEVQFIYFEF